MTENGNGNGWLKTVGVIVLSAATGIGGGIGQSYLREPEPSRSVDPGIAAEVSVLKARLEEMRQLANERERRFQVIEGRMDNLYERFERMRSDVHR